MQENLQNWGLLILTAICNASGVIIIKAGLNRQGPISFSPIRSFFLYFLQLLKSPLIILGAVLFFSAPILFAMALSRMDISIAQPALIGLNFCILMLCAVLFLKEKFSLRKGLGFSLVVLALVFFNLN